ncbi:pectinesterase inhibitor 10-like [Oreochromis aureus]|uniref:pectinesterase inhibitor 10-like n=1 Tax=Oreochromis aureus TaxID=47969 RepID=UPI001954AAC4|nr:pectinesterase inhibitor 10-like [Oreochromis aureus]XP_039464626.1 pectinesterase inhibitor 10-like [Oreochromis aureus]XP_039464627.1 pectinesterase inhibitor 10-like [Oreochromis aureus]
MKMRKLYEHLLRKLQASPPAKSSTPAAGPSSADSVDAGPVPDPEALNEEFILHLEPEPTSSLCQPPVSSSSSLLPPASSSSSLLPPASSSPSLLPPASSSPSPLPPASSSSSPLPTFPSISTAYTSDVQNKKRTRKECRKHRTQKIFKYEEIVDRRVVNEKEVKVKWKPCSIWVMQAQYWLKMQSHLLLLKTLPLSLTICKHTCLSNAVHACY